jgi:hypothetical protein
MSRFGRAFVERNCGENSKQGELHTGIMDSDHVAVNSEGS